MKPHTRRTRPFVLGPAREKQNTCVSASFYVDRRIAKRCKSHNIHISEGGVAKTARRLLAKQIIGSAILSAASKVLCGRFILQG